MQTYLVLKGIATIGLVVCIYFLGMAYFELDRHKFDTDIKIKIEMLDD